MSETPLQKLNKLCVTVAYATREWDQYNDYVVHSANVIPMAIEIESLHEQLTAARTTADYWKAEHLAGNELIRKQEADLTQIIESLRHQLADEKLCHAKTRERVADLEEELASCIVDLDREVRVGNDYLQRITELEATIKSHGTPKETLLDAHAEMVEQEELDDLNTELARLSRIEDVALEVVSSDTWSGDEFYDKLCKLKDTLVES